MKDVSTLLKQILNRIVYELFNRQAVVDAMEKETEAIKHQWR
jgi:hypothetical protein